MYGTYKNGGFRKAFTCIASRSPSIQRAAQCVANAAETEVAGQRPGFFVADRPGSLFLLPPAYLRLRVYAMISIVATAIPVAIAVAVAIAIAAELLRTANPDLAKACLADRDSCSLAALAFASSRLRSSAVRRLRCCLSFPLPIRTRDVRCVTHD